MSIGRLKKISSLENSANVISVCLVMIITSLLFRVSATEIGNNIVIASSNALSGPAGQLGSKLNQGANVYFDHINAQGGVNDKTIKFIQLDDGYEPLKTVINTKELLARKELFALFNFVGTPTTHAVYPTIKKHNVPFITPFTGAEFLREGASDMTVNLRASYYEEASAQIDYLVREKKFSRIGLLIQADEFGISAKKGFVRALKRHGMEPVVTTRYRRNTQGTALALSVLKEANLEAVIFIGTYEPLSDFINAARTHNFTPFYSTLSFISSEDLFSRLDQNTRVLVTEVFPEPMTCRKSICISFNKLMKDAGYLVTDRVQFEGFLNAHLFVEGVKQCKKQMTQTCVVNKVDAILKHYRAGKGSAFSLDIAGKNVHLNLFPKSP